VAEQENLAAELNKGNWYLLEFWLKQSAGLVVLLIKHWIKYLQYLYP